VYSWKNFILRAKKFSSTLNQNQVIISKDVIQKCVLYQIIQRMYVCNIIMKKPKFDLMIECMTHPPLPNANCSGVKNTF